MGKSMLNGVCYGSDEAIDIKYNNQNSGISATNTQAAIDELNESLNEQNKNLTASDSLKFKFATDGEGNYGYLGADDSFIPFRSTTLKETVNYELTGSGNTYTHTFPIPKGIKNALLILTIATSYSCDVNILGSGNLVGEVQTDYGYLCPQKYHTRTIVEKLSVVDSNAGNCVLKLTHSEETITNYVTIASMNFLY